MQKDFLHTLAMSLGISFFGIVEQQAGKLFIVYAGSESTPTKYRAEIC